MVEYRRVKLIFDEKLEENVLKIPLHSL